MHQEKYSLTWHTYSDHLRSMMKELMMNEEFADVTLVTEDKKQIKAHINILSACSPVFKGFVLASGAALKVPGPSPSFMIGVVLLTQVLYILKFRLSLYLHFF